MLVGPGGFAATGSGLRKSSDATRQPSPRHAAFLSGQVEQQEFGCAVPTDARKS